MMLQAFFNLEKKKERQRVQDKESRCSERLPSRQGVTLGWLFAGSSPEHGRVWLLNKGVYRVQR